MADFEIVNTRQRSLRYLESALIKTEEIQNLPRLRGSLQGLPVLSQKETNVANTTRGTKSTHGKTTTLTNKRSKEPRNKLLQTFSQKEVTPSHLIQSSIYDEPLNNPRKRSRKSLVSKSPRNTDEDAYRPTLKINEARRRISLSRQSRPSKIKEIPSDDDLEDSIEYDKIEYTKEFVQKRLKSSFKDKLTNLQVKYLDLKSHVNSPEMISQANSPGMISQANSPGLVSQANSPSYLDESPQPPSFSNSEVESPDSKIKRISKNVQKRQQELSQKTKQESKKHSTKQPSRTLRSNAPAIYTPPVPLTKTKRSEKQRPLTINIERLSHVDKRTKLNTLDVIKHLTEEFEPVDTNSKIINEPIIQEDFKLQVLHHIDYLMDIHSSINDLSLEISQVQKQKNDVRSKIYQLRQDHTGVGNELNNLRSEFRSQQDRYDEFNLIHGQFDQLKDVANAKSTETGLRKHVHSELRRLNRVVNPNSGIYKKLTVVNERLCNIDHNL